MSEPLTRHARSTAKVVTTQHSPFADEDEQGLTEKKKEGRDKDSFETKFSLSHSSLIACEARFRLDEHRAHSPPPSLCLISRPPRVAASVSARLWCTHASTHAPPAQPLSTTSHIAPAGHQRYPSPQSETHHPNASETFRRTQPSRTFFALTRLGFCNS